MQILQKINNYLNEGEISKDDLENLKNACKDWIENYKPNEAAKVILNLAPKLPIDLSQCKEKSVYRAIGLENKHLNSDEFTASPKIGKFMVFSQNQKLAYQAAQDFETGKNIYVYKKEIHKNDCLLNFTVLAKYLKLDNEKVEQELWLKPSRYITTFNKKEIVYTDNKDGVPKNKEIKKVYSKEESDSIWLKSANEIADYIITKKRWLNDCLKYIQYYINMHKKTLSTERLGILNQVPKLIKQKMKAKYG